MLLLLLLLLLLRVVCLAFQAKGERSYHAFYQLLAGAAADSRLRAELALEGGAASFTYAVAGGTVDAAGVDDGADFGSMMDALHNLGLDMGRQQAVLRVIGAVLHLGNVTFVPVSEMEEGAAVSAEGADVLDEVVRLLGVDTEALTSALTSKNIGSRSIILVPFTLEQAENARDALAKALYVRSLAVDDKCFIVLLLTHDYSSTCFPLTSPLDLFVNS